MLLKRAQLTAPPGCVIALLNGVYTVVCGVCMRLSLPLSLSLTLSLSPAGTGYSLNRSRLL